MKIVICDDLAADRSALRLMLNEYFSEKCIDASIDEFTSGEALLARFSAGAYDVVFLDIYMKELTGIDTAKKLRALDSDAAVIFTTTSTEFAVESYDLDAVSYLVKPIDKGKLFHALDKCGSLLAKVMSVIEVMSNRLTEKIYIKDIRYIETFGRKSTICCGEISIDTNTPLSKLETELSRHSFIRISRSAVINPAHVRMLKDEGFLMDNGKDIPFSIKEKTRIKQEFMSYCRRITRG